MTSPLPGAVAERLDHLDTLDPPAEQVGEFFRGAIPKGSVKDALSGTWLGHPLHAVLTDLPIGAFTSAVVCDALGEAEAARKLIGVGIAVAPPTFLSGWNDWADTEPANEAVRRSGLVHALTNGVAANLMIASYLKRRNGRGGRLLSLAGLGLFGVAGWIGGHLTFSQGVGVDTTTFDTGPTEWTRVQVDELPEGEPVCAIADNVPVMLVRVGGEIKALHNRCPHRGGSLADGELGDNTITCPLHGSTFSLDDGSVQRGPAAYPAPVFEARETPDGIEVRRVRR